jgi:DNA-directed RNA polymerase specialized sigma24 family protein
MLLEELNEVREKYSPEALHAITFREMGYSPAEVAELLERSEKAVEMIVYRHRRRVRAEGEAP